MATDKMALALRRFGYGARPGDLKQLTGDPKAAVLAELDIADIAILDDPSLPSASEAFVGVRLDQRERRNTRRLAIEAARNKDNSAMAGGMAMGSAAVTPPKNMAGDTPMLATGDAMAGPAMGGAMAGAGKAAPAADKAAPATPPKIAPVNAFYYAEIGARYQQQQDSDIGFVERLVAFWANHFAVQVEKDQLVRGMAGAFEREAIRPYVLGRFEDMLVAVTRHPAMLISLDNFRSVGPNSIYGQKGRRGLNENHGRELLELHTVGVNGGYTQQDVTSLATILTGWSLVGDVRREDAGRFMFIPEWHEPGDHVVMGRTYKADILYPVGNLGQGLAVLHDLAVNRATAIHLSRKLVSHFIADDPPQDLVDKVSLAFLRSGGNLKTVAQTLVKADEAWGDGKKFVTPQVFVSGSHRALGLDVDGQKIAALLKALGQSQWSPISPEGFHDDAATWLSPEAMTTRLEIADRLAQQTKLHMEPDELVTSILGPDVSPETRQAVQRAESTRQAVALLVMSPEFQWR